MTHIESSLPHLVRELAFAAVLMAAIFSPAALLARPQAPAPADLGTPPPDLVALLKATPGVLGIDAARTLSGKEVIFAWFEDKAAVVNWVRSDAHRQLVRAFAPGASSGRPPLAEIPDGSGPILTIASITMAAAPAVNGVQMPVSQIAIELYAPLPGGLAAGGRFAPAAVRVPGLLATPAMAPPSKQ